MYQDDPFSTYEPYIEPASTAPYSAGVADKVANLAAKRDNKINKLSSYRPDNRTGYGEHDALQDTFLDVGGFTESAANKIFNDYTPAQLEYLGQRLNNAYGVVETPEGLFSFDENGGLVPYTGNPDDLASYYEYETTDGNIKAGRWGGRNPADRYSPEYLERKRLEGDAGSYIGELGVDPSKLRKHYLMPRHIVNTYEALVHGSSANMENRALRLQTTDQDSEEFQTVLQEYRAMRDRIGTGATEVYRPRDTSLDQEFDRDELWRQVNDRFEFNRKPLSEMSSEERKEYFRKGIEQYGAHKGSPNDFVNRAYNTGAALGAAFTRSLIVDPAAAVGNFLGFDVGTPEERTKAVNEFFGYDASFSAATMEEITKSIGEMYDADKVDLREVLRLMGRAIMTPEILADSLGFVGATVVGTGKFTATGKLIAGVEKAYKTGAIKTKAEALKQVRDIKKTASVMDNTTHFLGKNAGFGLTVAGTTNSAVQEFAENNNGEVTAHDVLRIAAIQTAVVGMDRFAASVIMKDIPGIRKAAMYRKESTEAFKKLVVEMTPKDYLKASEAVMKVLGAGTTLVTAAGKEGATEYTQTMLEVFSTQYATEKYGEEFGKIFADRANQIEALAGAVVGTAMGAEMSAANLAAAGLSKGLPKGTPAVNAPASDTTAHTPEEIAQDKDRYNIALTKLRNMRMEGTLNAENLGDILSAHAELTATRYALADSPAEGVAAADAELEAVENIIVSLIDNSEGDIEISRITRAPQQAPSAATQLEEASSVVASVDNRNIVLEYSEQDGTAVVIAKEGEDGVVVGIASYDPSNVSINLDIKEDFDGQAPNEAKDNAVANAIQHYVVRRNGITSNIEGVTLTADGVEVLPRTDNPADSVSDQEASSVVETTPAQRKAYAENLITVYASRKGESITDEDVEKLKVFGSRNGVTPKRIEALVRSFASVETEATIEDRGYIAREQRLRTTLASGTATKKEIQRQYDEAVSFYASTLESIRHLTEGIEAAKAKAQTAVKPSQHTTEYLKAKNEAGKREKYTLNIVREGDKYVVNPAEVKHANELISAKQTTASNLLKLLNTFQQEASQYLSEDTVLGTGGYRVTRAKTGEGKKKGDIEENYINKILEELQDVDGAGKAVNRVILGSDPAAQWKGGERVLTNAHITNLATAQDPVGYESTDVVYLHVPKVIEGKKGKDKKDAEGNVVKEAKDSYYSEVATDSTAGKELRAAMEAGATIILDNGIASEPNGKAAVAIANYILKHKDFDYVRLASVKEPGGFTFVPADAEGVNAARYEASVARVAEKEKADNARKASEARLVAARYAEKAASIPGYVGRPKDAVKEDMETAIHEALPRFLGTARTQLVAESKEAGKGADTVTDAAVEERARRNIQTFADNRIAKDVRGMLLAVERNNTPIEEADFGASERTAVIRQAYKEQEARKEGSTHVINAWSKAAANRLSGKALIEAVNTDPEVQAAGMSVTASTEGSGDLVVKKIAEDILSTSSGAQHKKDVYFVLTQVMEGKKYTDKWSTVLSEKEAERHRKRIGKETTSDGKATRTLSVNKLTMNPSEYVRVARETPLNTLPVGTLPAVFGRLADRMKVLFDKTIKPFSAKEIVNEDGDLPHSEKEKRNYASIDSPARTLVFNEKGEVSPNVLAAMAIAIGDVLKVDLQRLMLGPKDDKAIASMFNVHEGEITSEMRTLAAENGMFMKTLTNTLGKSVLGMLGMAKRKGEVNRGTYERLATDLGNMVLEMGVADGIFQIKDVPSNVIAEFLTDGEQQSEEQTTKFVNVTSKKAVSKGKVETKHNTNTAAMIADFELVEALMPDPASRKKEPKFGKKISPERKAELTSTIRNDLVNGQVPEKAKETLALLMDVAYEIDTETVSRLAEEVKTDPTMRQALLEHLGWVEMVDSNPVYVKMTQYDKDVQEAKNRDAEKSLDTLLEYYEAVEGGLTNQMFFEFFYASNHRYMMDSNTINTQADKFHRFLVNPVVHKAKYTISKGHRFTYHYTTKDGEKKSVDTSFLIRAAVLQAMGFDVDKSSPRQIIEIGNSLLSLTADQVLSAREQAIRNKKFTIIDGKGTPIELEPAHIGHALQAFEFLHKYQTRGKANTVETSLSIEFDALTSGFGNKMQQFGLTENALEHMRRVGIIQKDIGEEIYDMVDSPMSGLSEMLGNPDLLDSYKSAAKDAIERVPHRVKALLPEYKTTFKALSGLFPGGDAAVDGAGNTEGVKTEISSALRKMFKQPFMIFNYAAGINRIKANLSDDIVTQLFRDIAAMDLPADIDTLPAEQAAALKELSKLTRLSVKELQHKLRNSNESAITVVKKVYKEGATTPTLDHTPLRKYLVDNITTPTYGAAVEESFKTQFKEFIRIQNATNQAFKLMFGAFNKALTDRIADYRENGEGVVITEEHVLGWIDELHDIFPAIAGPLSANVKEGIHVYDSDTRTPSGAMATLKPAQLRRNNETRGERTRVANSIVKSIVAAANSGAVLPFHAIDGAQTAHSITSFMAEVIGDIQELPGGDVGVLPIHDAFMSLLAFADTFAYIYNRETVDINTNYNIMEQVKGMMERLKDVLDGKHETIKLDGSKIEIPAGMVPKDADKRKAAMERAKKTISKLEKKPELTAMEQVRLSEARQDYVLHRDGVSYVALLELVTKEIESLTAQVNEAREKVYQDGTIVNPLVGGPGSGYKVDRTANNASKTKDHAINVSTEYTRSTEMQDMFVEDKGVTLVQPQATNEAPAGNTSTDADGVGVFSNTGMDTSAIFEFNADSPAVNTVQFNDAAFQAEEVRASIADAVLYTDPETAPREAVLQRIDEAIKPSDIDGSVHLVLTAPKDFHGVEDTHILDSWATTQEAAEKLLAGGAVLLFSSSKATEAKDNGKHRNGEAYIYEHLTGTGKYNTVTVTVNNGSKTEQVLVMSLRDLTAADSAAVPLTAVDVSSEASGTGLYSLYTEAQVQAFEEQFPGITEQLKDVQSENIKELLEMFGIHCNK